MKKVMVMITFFAIIVLAVQACVKPDLEDKIYTTFFEDVRYAFILPIYPEGVTYILDDELEVIKESMKNVKVLRKYSRNSQIGDVFINEDYHLLFIQFNSMKQLGILYSLKDRIWIARKYDVYPGTEKPNSEVITVYDIELPETVAAILEKHEKLLPKESIYFNSWDLDY